MNKEINTKLSQQDKSKKKKPLKENELKQSGGKGGTPTAAGTNQTA